MAFAWTTELETGNPAIDAQHKQLIAAINGLLEACGKGLGRVELTKTMNFLSDYTAKHFGDEEKLQIKHKYPTYIAHKALHDGFRKTVADIAADLHKEGPNTALVARVNSSVGDWLVRHIKTEDVKLAKFIRDQG